MHLRTLSFAIGMLLAVAGAAAVAHEGHDHDKPAPLNLPVAPRVVAVTPDFELVGVASGRDRLTIFLHTFATGEPIKGARMSVAAGNNSAEAEPKGDGVFTLAAPWLAVADTVDLVFSVSLKDGTQDLLAGRLQNLSAAAPLVAQSSGRSLFQRLRQQPELAAMAIGGAMSGILLTLLLGGAARRRRSRSTVELDANAPEPAQASVTPSRSTVRRASGVVLAVCLFGQPSLLVPSDARAAGGVSLDLPSVPTTMATDLAQRMSDGTLFVPKATQHLLGVRTMLTAMGDATMAVELTGTVIPGPENFGRVQPGRPGRIEAVPGGLAYIGKQVEKGQILAYVQTYIEAADRANIDSQIAETEARIDKNRTILSRYERSPGSVPQVKIDEIRGELEALKRKRAELLPAGGARAPIVAPISGVVSLANATIGQIVEARDVLFEIVDPSQFWVEAHGHSHESLVVQNLTSAVGLVAGSRQLQLQFVGRGLTLRQQASVFTFRIMGKPADISIGMPVKVVLRSSAKVNGYIVPASAIVRGQTGLPIVWVKTEPERFEPQTVKVEPLDGKSVVVTSGLKDDLRIVTDGVTLLNQVR